MEGADATGGERQVAADGDGLVAVGGGEVGRRDAEPLRALRHAVEATGEREQRPIAVAAHRADDRLHLALDAGASLHAAGLEPCEPAPGGGRAGANDQVGRDHTLPFTTRIRAPRPPSFESRRS